MKLWDFDNQIRNQYNIKILSGSDEVGRGAMAGPIVVASIIMKEDFFDTRIKDSKLLSETMRESLYDLIIENCISYSICEYDAQNVDKLNPKRASQLGMIDTIKKLKVKPEMCLVDAEKIVIDGYEINSIIKGDYKSFSIACASIIAKVYRDRILTNYEHKWPGYGFKNHKGYCTKSHIEATTKLGILPVHRLSYKPIKLIKEKNV
ncbi:ribonuclease HII [Spiroplasma endosymbiont of Crioceris asparagi]|uniref:ribonuclease HII n=1 Tax=Spiroplasma endosymbiont of Crioceris asparagi TaxID=3066286 RepID=UPI0030D52747